MFRKLQIFISINSKRIFCLRKIITLFDFFILSHCLILNNRASFSRSTSTIWSSFIYSFCAFFIIIILFLYWKFENIIFKISFFDNSISKNYLTKSMLNSLFPFTFIFTTINPNHFPITMTLILVKISFVNIPACPDIGTFALF